MLDLDNPSITEIVDALAQLPGKSVPSKGEVETAVGTRLVEDGENEFFTFMKSAADSASWIGALEWRAKRDGSAAILIFHVREGASVRGHWADLVSVFNSEPEHLVDPPPLAGSSSQAQRHVLRWRRECQVFMFTFSLNQGRLLDASVEWIRSM